MALRIVAAVFALWTAVSGASAPVAARQATDVSLIVANGIVITVDGARRILSPGFTRRRRAVILPRLVSPSEAMRQKIRRDAREAEGAPLLREYRVKSLIEGSNPSLSASFNLTVLERFRHNSRSARP